KRSSREDCAAITASPVSAARCSLPKPHACKPMLERRTPASDCGPSRHDSADMTDPDRAERLERRYRRLLRAYPSSYREQRSDELVAVLMSAAEPGRRAPTFAERVDLVRSGLRTRLTLARRDLRAPVSACAIRHAGLV